MNAAKYIRYILTIATALLFFSAYTYLLVGSLAFAINLCIYESEVFLW